MSSPSGSRTVLHSHITAQDPSGGAKPGSHTSREGSRTRCSQPQLWPAASLCPWGQVTPAKRWSLGYWVSLATITNTKCAFNLQIYYKEYRCSFSTVATFFARQNLYDESSFTLVCFLIRGSGFITLLMMLYLELIM